jgi:hypothetical protein
LACYSFFKKIYENNQQAYKALMSLIEIERLPKGKIVTMLGEKALKTYFILRGQLGVYVRINFSSDKRKSYK